MKTQRGQPKKHALLTVAAAAVASSAAILKKGIKKVIEKESMVSRQHRESIGLVWRVRRVVDFIHGNKSVATHLCAQCLWWMQTWGFKLVGAAHDLADQQPPCLRQTPRATALLLHPGTEHSFTFLPPPCFQQNPFALRALVGQSS